MRSTHPLLTSASALALILAASAAQAQNYLVLPVIDGVHPETLDAANEYTDTRFDVLDQRIGRAIDTLLDQPVGNYEDAVSESNSYTDTQTAETYERSTSYTDTQTAETYERSTSYTDSALQNYATNERVDRVFSDSLSQAKSYTDQRYSQGFSQALSGYATTQALNDSFAKAISEANSYTDRRVWDALTQSYSYTDAQVERLERILSSGIAAVAAQPDLPTLGDGQIGIAIGTGHYNGYNALGAALGYAPTEGLRLGIGFSGSLGAEDGEKSQTVVRTSASYVW